MVISILRAPQQRSRADPRGKQREHQHERRQRSPGNQIIGLGFYFAQPRERNNQKSQNNGADQGGVQRNHEFPSLFVMASVRANATTGNRVRLSQKVVILTLNGVKGKDLLFFASATVQGILCAAKGGRATISDSQSCPNTFGALPGNPHHLVTRLSTADNLTRRRRHIQQLCKEPDQRLIGSALNRRSLQRDLQYLVAQNARNRRSASPRLHPHLKTHPSRSLAQRNHAGFGREPKIAVPIRTSVDPSSMAISKSPDIPIDSSPKSSPGYRAANLFRS